MESEDDDFLEKTRIIQFDGKKVINYCLSHKYKIKRYQYFVKMHKYCLKNTD